MVVKEYNGRGEGFSLILVVSSDKQYTSDSAHAGVLYNITVHFFFFFFNNNILYYKVHQREHCSLTLVYRLSLLFGGCALRCQLPSIF